MPEDTTEPLQLIDELFATLTKTQEAFLHRPSSLQQLPPSNVQFRRWIAQIDEQRFHSNQTFTMMVLGEFNAGKSTVLNALLELPTELRLPSGDDPVTGKPLRLRYTDNAPHALLLMHDGSEQAIDWKVAVKSADQRRNSSELHLDQVREVQFFLNHPLLANMDILDMPGTGTAEFKEHTQLTRDYLDNVEMIVWVIGETEPSSEGGRDFRKALRTEAPIIVIFNAWGSLHNKGMEIDQEVLEQGVLNKFSEIQEDPFRLYARKCLETQESYWAALKLPSAFSHDPRLVDRLKQLEQQQGYKDKIDDFGLQAFKDYLWENYLGNFDEHRMRVRQQALAATIRLAKQMEVELEDVLKAWQIELDKASDLSIQHKNMLNRLNTLQGQVRTKIKTVAEPYTEDISDKLLRKLNLFIEDKVKPTNVDIWKNIFNKAQLKETLEQQLKTDYLELDKPINNFTVVAQEFVHDAQAVLDAEWRRVLDDMEVEMAAFQTTGQPGPDMSSVLERVTGEALSAVQQTIMKIVTSLAAIAFIIFGNVLTLLFLIIAAPFGFKPGASPQDKAKKRVRDEIDGQYLTIRKSLIDIIMEQDGIYKKQEETFRTTINQNQQQSTAQTNNVLFGIEALKRLQQSFDLGKK